MSIAETGSGDADADRWVTVALDERHSVRVLVAPGAGRPVVKRIEPAEGSDEVPVSALRGLKVKTILKALRADAAPAAESVHAQAHNRTDEDLLAMVGIAHDEFEASGVRDVSRAVAEWLDELHDISHDKTRDPYLRDGEPDEPWQWGDAARIRKYTRQGVRGLIRKARDAEYIRRPAEAWTGIDECQTPEQLDERLRELGVTLEEIPPAEYSATGTLARARQRQSAYWSADGAQLEQGTADAAGVTYGQDVLVAAAIFHNGALRQGVEPSDYARQRFRERRRREDRQVFGPDEIKAVFRASRADGYLSADGTATAKALESLRR